MTNHAPSVHRFTLDLALPPDIDANDALSEALGQMSSDLAAHGMPNRVSLSRWREPYEVLYVDNAPDADIYDTASSASRQHYIETGRYLRHDDDDGIPVENDVWNNDLIQFARLLAEIVVNQDDLDIDALCESMDLPASRVHELLDRADAVWNNAKASHGLGDVA